VVTDDAFAAGGFRMESAAVTTIIGAFLRSVSRAGDKEFVRYHDGKGWLSVTYGAFAERVERLGAGFAGLGLEPGDRLAILAENRIEWALTDYAAMSAGLITVPLYATLPASQIAYILCDSEAKGVVVSSPIQASKIAEIQSECPTLKIVVCMDAEATVEVDGARSFVDLERLATDDAIRLLCARRNDAKPEDILTFIYTSGTTGNPKGVILTHDNFLSNVEAGLEALDIAPSDLFLSFLPLSHVFERMAGHYLPMYAGAAIAYSRGLRFLVNELKEVAPTVMACVPRFYESLQERVLKSVESQPAIRQRIFHWAMRQGRAKSRAIQEKRPTGLVTTVMNSIAHKLVFHKLHETVGGRLRYFVSGGAPLALSTAQFFHAAGILILEGYGLTETSPVISVNRERNFRFGTVGPAIPGVQVKIAPDGEILSRGRHIMKGYFKLEKETTEAIDADGWFHTGDLGELDEDGFLRITGRKKNLLKLSNGKYVAPEPIENALKASPYITESVVFGDAQKVAGALIVPTFAALEELAHREGYPAERAELVKHPLVRKLYRQEIDRLTPNLADFERIRVFLIADHEFTVDAGELTPTLKVRRKEVLGAYAEQIAALYATVD
jgi:long-chain acyl-CoA synthetase